MLKGTNGNDAANPLLREDSAMPFYLYQYDVVCLIEGPDDTFMMAGAAAVASAGTVSTSATTKLMTSADAMAAMTKAGEVMGSYQPPHG